MENVLDNNNPDHLGPGSSQVLTVIIMSSQNLGSDLLKKPVLPSHRKMSLSLTPESNLMLPKSMDSLTYSMLGNNLDSQLSRQSHNSSMPMMNSHRKRESSVLQALYGRDRFDPRDPQKQRKGSS